MRLLDSRPFRVSLVVAAVSAVACFVYAAWRSYEYSRAALAFRRGLDGLTAADVLLAADQNRAAWLCVVLIPLGVLLLGRGLHWALNHH